MGVHKSQVELEEYVSKLVDDFVFFSEELWKEIGLPDIAEHQRQIGRWLQHGPRVQLYTQLGSPIYWQP